MVSQAFQILRLLHVVVAVFMAAPLYLLIVSNERGRQGPPLNFRVERYMENIIKGQPRRCYVYLAVLLLSGLALMLVRGYGLGALVSNSLILIKTILLVALFGLITMFTHRSSRDLRISFQKSMITKPHQKKSQKR